MIDNSPLDEHDLIVLIRNKKKAGAEALFDQYQKVLSLVIFRLVQDKQKTDELLESVIVRIWSTIDLFNEHEKTFLSWVIAVAKQMASES